MVVFYTLYLVRLFIAISFIFVLSSCSSQKSNVEENIVQPTTTSDSVVNVAVILPMDGKYKSVGESMLYSIYMSYSEHKDSNTKINFNIYSSIKNNKNVSKEAAQQALKDKNSVIIGPLFSESLESIIPVVNGEIPIISYVNNSSLILNSKNVYTTAFLLENDIEASLSYIFTINPNARVAALVPDTNLGNSELNALMQGLKDRDSELVKFAYYPHDQVKILSFIDKLVNKTQLRKYRSKLKNLKNMVKKSKTDQAGEELEEDTTVEFPKLDFDVLFILEHGKKIAFVTTHLPYAGIDYRAIRIVGNSYWRSEKTIKKENVFNGSIYPKYLNLEGSKFDADYQIKFNRKPIILDVYAYDSVKLLLSSIDGTDVSINFDQSLGGALGKFMMQESGMSIHELSITELYHSKEHQDTIPELENLEYFKVKKYTKYINPMCAVVY